MRQFVQYDNITGDIIAVIVTPKAPPAPPATDEKGNPTNIGQVEHPVSERVDPATHRMKADRSGPEQKPKTGWDRFVEKWRIGYIIEALNDPVQLAKLQADALDVDVQARASELRQRDNVLRTRP